jgi:hypothetical protein
MNEHRTLFLALVMFITASAVLGQSRLECGKVQSDSLSIPSYKFIVVDKNGNQFRKLRAVGVVEMRTWVWRYIYGDWNWNDENLLVTVPVTFDRKQGAYISKAITKLKIKDTGSREYQCLDRLRRFYVGFTLGRDFNEAEGFSGSYSLDLLNKKQEEIAFPDASEPIKITLKSWGGAKEP